MLLHMHESNEAETDKRGGLVQMRRLHWKIKKKRKTHKMEQKQSGATDEQAPLSTPAWRQVWASH